MKLINLFKMMFCLMVMTLMIGCGKASDQTVSASGASYDIGIDMLFGGSDWVSNNSRPNICGWELSGSHVMLKSCRLINKIDDKRIQLAGPGGIEVKVENSTTTLFFSFTINGVGVSPLDSRLNGLRVMGAIRAR